VVCGFRPEAVVPDARSPVKMRIKLIEPTGAETHVFAELGGADVIAVVRERVAFASGAEVGVTIPPEQIHLFDAATTARLN
jgi:multiple sugar transport system ATP-binding protein